MQHHSDLETCVKSLDDMIAHHYETNEVRKPEQEEVENALRYLEERCKKNEEMELELTTLRAFKDQIYWLFYQCVQSSHPLRTKEFFQEVALVLSIKGLRGKYDPASETKAEMYYTGASYMKGLSSGIMEASTQRELTIGEIIHRLKGYDFRTFQAQRMGEALALIYLFVNETVGGDELTVEDRTPLLDVVSLKNAMQQQHLQDDYASAFRVLNTMLHQFYHSRNPRHE